MSITLWPNSIYGSYAHIAKIIVINKKVICLSVFSMFIALQLKINVLLRSSNSTWHRAATNSHIKLIWYWYYQFYLFIELCEVNSFSHSFRISFEWNEQLSHMVVMKSGFIACNNFVSSSCCSLFSLSRCCEDCKRCE